MILFHRFLKHLRYYKIILFEKCRTEIYKNIYFYIQFYFA